MLAYRRALTGGDPSLLQVSFDVAVLDRYRGAAGYSLIRSDTVGRLQKERVWGIDFGIAEGERAIHACWSDLAGLPEGEREHWAQHVVALPLSDRFLQMRLSPGACIDDGETREWE
jgi:hypothetical protein